VYGVLAWAMGNVNSLQIKRREIMGHHLTQEKGKKLRRVYS
jgi:hypothetical protein